MEHAIGARPPEPVPLLRWAAGLGAVTAEALALREGCGLHRARGRLSAACRAGLLRRARPLRAEPSLYTVTGAGLAAGGLPEARSGRVSPTGARHAIACATAAALLEGIYPGSEVIGEGELRRREREPGGPYASAILDVRPDGSSVLHRPDLVLVAPGSVLPTAAEVELTVKAPERLDRICRAWARCRHVAGVLYLADPAARGALERAVGRVGAGERILVLDLEGLRGRPNVRTVPGEAYLRCPGGQTI